MKIVPPKLDSFCVDYLQNKAPSGNGEDLVNLSPYDPNLKVTLADEELWKKFSSTGTEMVVTKPGR